MPDWKGSDRRRRLPSDWQERRAEAKRRNPQRICHWCGLPGGTDLDHKEPGDRHDQDNLDWIHSAWDVKAGRSEKNCHAQKTSADRPSKHRVEKHPAR